MCVYVYVQALTKVLPSRAQLFIASVTVFLLHLYSFCTNHTQVWKIEDFLAKWSKATEGKGADDPIAMILLKEIDAYRRCLPHLKTTMRGAGWEENHWLQVCG